MPREEIIFSLFHDDEAVFSMERIFQRNVGVLLYVRLNSNYICNVLCSSFTAAASENITFGTKILNRSMKTLKILFRTMCHPSEVGGK